MLVGVMVKLAVKHCGGSSSEIFCFSNAAFR